MSNPDFYFEQQHTGLAAGIDEAGCGPWAGPVIAAAVIWQQNCLPNELRQKINDSKKLSKALREKIFSQLQEIQGKNVHFGIGLATVTEIDELNIGKATRLSMLRALEQLPLQPDVALVDGIRRPELPCPIQMIVKGDQKSLSIATASIIAKVYRDKLMAQLHEQFPYYGWDRNAGYGTAMHIQGLKTKGVTIHHRHSFKPIAAFVQSLPACKAV